MNISDQTQTIDSSANSDSRGSARLGFIVPYSNTNLEPDMVIMRPPGCSLHFARAGGYDLDKVPDSDQMRQYSDADLEPIMQSISACRPDAVVYGCTSATLAQGVAYDIAFRLRMEALAGVPAVTAAGALAESLSDLGVNRIGFASPYTQVLNQEGAAFLESAGFQTTHLNYVGSDLGNYGQGELTPDQVFQLGLGADHPDADVIVLSCTDLRAVEVIERLEAAVGKPVVCSNQALMYVTAKRLEIRGQIPGRLGRI